VLVPFREVKGDELLDTGGRRDAGAPFRRQVLGRARELAMFLDEARLAVEDPRASGERRERSVILLALVEIGRVRELLAGAGVDESALEIRGLSHGAVGEGNQILAPVLEEKPLQIAEPGARAHPHRRDCIGPNVKRRRLLEGEREDGNAVVESHGPHPEIGLVEEDVTWKLAILEGLSPVPSRLKPEAYEFPRMDLVYDKDRSAVADAIPANAGDHALDVGAEARRTVERARSRRADRRAQEPEEPADVIDVSVRDEDVRHLVDDPRGKPCGLSEIEKKAALAMSKADVEQRVAEDSVDEKRLRRAQRQNRRAQLGGAIPRPQVGLRGFNGG